MGLIAFSGQAFLQCPLTRDYDAFFRTLEETDTTSIQVPGTDIGRAIEEAELAFFTNRNRKLVIILTDGEDLAAGGVEMAKQLKRKGLVVHTVGVGTPSGGPIRVLGQSGSLETMKDPDGGEILSRLDEKTLGEIAEAANGRFVRLGQGGGKGWRHGMHHGGFMDGVEFQRVRLKRVYESGLRRRQQSAIAPKPGFFPRAPAACCRQKPGARRVRHARDANREPIQQKHPCSRVRCFGNGSLWRFQ